MTYHDVVKHCEVCQKRLVLTRTIHLTRKRFCSRTCRAKANAHHLPVPWGRQPWNDRGGYIDQAGYRVVKGVREQVRVLPLPSGLIRHHKNGNKTDNRLENLEVLTQAEHARKHLTPERARAMAHRLWERRHAKSL